MTTTIRMSAAKYVRGFTFACAFAGAATFVVACDDDTGQGAIAPGDPGVVETDAAATDALTTRTTGTAAGTGAVGATGSGSGTGTLAGDAPGGNAAGGDGATANNPDGDTAMTGGDAAAGGDGDTSPASTSVQWTPEGLRFEYSGSRLPCDGSLILKGKKLDKKTAEVRVIDVNKGREKVGCLERTTLSIVLEGAPRTVETVKFYPEVGDMQSIAVVHAAAGMDGAATDTKTEGKKR